MRRFPLAFMVDIVTRGKGDGHLRSWNKNAALASSIRGGHGLNTRMISERLMVCERRECGTLEAGTYMGRLPPAFMVDNNTCEICGS